MLASRVSCRYDWQMSFETGNLGKKTWFEKGRWDEQPATVFMVVDYEEGQSELSGQLVTNALKVLSADMGALGEDLANDEVLFGKPNIDKQLFFGSAVVLATCRVTGSVEPLKLLGYK